MKETFRTATIFLIATLSMTLGTFAFGTTSPLSLGDTASVHLDPDGGYIAYCKNGDIEHISDMDLKLDNMCPRLEKIDSLGILSIQMREDGNFDVLCQDLSKATVTREEILSGKV
ncbi:MAG TPA: hypothetical protein DCL41_01875, partial [Bdellovibrionales bacterium]|nr:hypothetical protein [Bdellovibrionales bacterium]